MTEVRKCKECGSRANWEWLKGAMQAGTWGRRCGRETCQHLDNWLPTDPDPPDRKRVSNAKYYIENPGEFERMLANKPAEES